MGKKIPAVNRVSARALLLTFVILVLSSVACPGEGSSIEANSRTAGGLDESVLSEIVDSVLTALTTHYVFPDKARELAMAVRENLESGRYDRLLDLEQLVSELSSDLREMSKDRHIKIAVIPPGGLDEFASDSVTGDQIAEIAGRNFGFKDAKILPGNVGYLDVRVFEDPSYAGATAAAAVEFLANTDAMIIDVRGNGGGHGGMVELLCSYFFTEPQPLNSFYSYATDSITQRRTLIFLSGKRRPAIDLYILADKYSASAAEDFLYSLQSLKRATVVGETTAGAANTVDFYPFANLGVLARISTGYPINPITGTNWEGVGVKPDIETSSEEALKVAHHTALKRLAEKASGKPMSFELEWALLAYEAEVNPIRLSRNKMENYAGAYGGVKVIIKGEELYFVRGERTWKMIPLSEKLFRFDEIDYMRIRVILDESDRAIALHAVYDDGYINSYYRNGN